jgi:hypothetical protein
MQKVKEPDFSKIAMILHSLIIVARHLSAWYSDLEPFWRSQGPFLGADIDVGGE